MRDWQREAVSVVQEKMTGKLVSDMSAAMTKSEK